MTINDIRYQVRLKQAVLEAHAHAMTSIAEDIEYNPDEGFSISEDDYRMNEDECFAKYWKIVSEIE